MLPHRGAAEGHAVRGWAPGSHSFQVMYQLEHIGQTATYFGRWITRTGKTGPWSLPVAMMIA